MGIEDSPTRKGVVVWGIVSLFAGAFFVFVIPSALPATHDVLGFVSRAGIMGSLIFLISFRLVNRPADHNVSMPVGRFEWLGYAMPCFVVWTLYLLAFWPGTMGPDSLEQWEETLTGRFSDWHPAFHTLNIWLINRLWVSPASVASAQILALGSMAGWGLTAFRRLGTPRSILWGVSLFFALSPVNGLMAVTLWKDIPYSVSVLMLTLLLIRIADSNGEWLLRPGAWMMLAFVVFLVASYRYNGIISGFGTLFVLFIPYLRFWRRLTLALVLSLVLFVGLRGPLYALLDVDCSRRPSLTSRLPKSLKTITPLSSNQEDHPGEEDLMEALGKDLQSGSQIWRIKPLYHYFKRIEYANLWKDNRDTFQYIIPNELGIAPSSLLPNVKGKLLAFYEQSIKPPLYYFIWSPAFYLYVFLISVAVASARAGSWKFLFLSTPLVLHAFQFLLMQIPGQKFIHRYHYPVILVGALLSIPLLFIKKKAR